jgi:S1-C subfamily serine protease
MAESLNLREVRGVIVSSVEDGSAAEKAGVKKGDVIVSFAGQPVRDLNALRNRVAESEPGSKHPIVIVRDGREQTLSVTLDEREASRTAANTDSSSNSPAASTLGVRVSPLTAERARRERMPEGTRGLVIEDVDPNSRAASAGLQVGDVITEANRRPVESVDDLRSAVKQSASRPVLLLVMRDGRELFMTVRPS